MGKVSRQLPYEGNERRLLWDDSLPLSLSISSSFEPSQEGSELLVSYLTEKEKAILQDIMGAFLRAKFLPFYTMPEIEILYLKLFGHMEC